MKSFVVMFVDIYKREFLHERAKLYRLSEFKFNFIKIN